MKILLCSLLNIFLLLNTASWAAPVGNTGNPFLWDDGLLAKTGSILLMATLDFDYQTNRLPNQINRFTWEDPRQVSTESRHYKQVRSSKNQYYCNGLKLGAAMYESAVVYLMAGVCNTSVDLTYYDKTIAYDYEVKENFKSDNDFYYGAGASFLMYQGAYKKDTPVEIGLDIKYRKLEMEDDDFSSAGKFYSSSFDEMQMALVVSAETGPVNPYFGYRISATLGEEHYINRNQDSSYSKTGYIDYKNDITWFKNTGYVAGMSFYLKGLCLINFEIREGDEKGLGLSSTIKF